MTYLYLVEADIGDFMMLVGTTQDPTKIDKLIEEYDDGDPIDDIYVRKINLESNYDDIREVSQNSEPYRKVQL